MIADTHFGRVGTAARTGVYTFRAGGGLYHERDNLVPADNDHQHLQLYIYDTYDNLIHRAKRSPNLNIEVIQKILRIPERTLILLRNLDPQNGLCNGTRLR